MHQRAPDRFLKRIWLINGILVLALLVVGGGAVVYSILSERRDERAVAVGVQPDTVARGAPPPTR